MNLYAHSPGTRYGRLLATAALLTLISSKSWAASPHQGDYFGTTTGAGEEGAFGLAVRADGRAIPMRTDEYDGVGEGWIDAAIVFDGSFFLANIDGEGANVLGSISGTAVREADLLLAPGGESFGFGEVLAPAFGKRLSDGGSLSHVATGTVAAAFLGGVVVSGVSDLAGGTRSGHADFSGDLREGGPTGTVDCTREGAQMEGIECPESGASSADQASFDGLGGYTAYLANPDNSDLLAAGVCDETVAFEHWRDSGLAQGRGFAEGELRTDKTDDSPDSDYEIDGGFSWEYPGANTVVFITADAPKPEGWDGRFLLLERCQTFNIGSYYTAQDYRTINVDVAKAIDGGLIPGFLSVTDHYVKYGFKEGRLTNSNWSPAELDVWDDASYFANNKDAETYFLGAQSEGWVAFGKIGFAHWINFGWYEGRSNGQ